MTTHIAKAHSTEVQMNYSPHVMTFHSFSVCKSFYINGPLRFLNKSYATSFLLIMEMRRLTGLLNLRAFSLNVSPLGPIVFLSYTGHGCKSSTSA